LSNAIKFGLPKGSLQNSTFDLFKRAGFHVHVSSRSYFPSIDDDEIEPVLFRAQEMSRYVEDGVLDAGLTGHDWICENGSDVVEVCELVYSKATAKPAYWVLAVPHESSVQKAEDLEGGIIATELVKVTQNYFAKKKINVKVEFSWGGDGSEGAFAGRDCGNHRDGIEFASEQFADYRPVDDQHDAADCQ